MKFILGQKQEMSQVFKEDKVIPITVIKTGLCKIIQAKTIENDGYEAVQVGFLSKRKINKPKKGHLKGMENFRYLKEFRINDNKFKVGDILDIESFKQGDKAKVTGISKGKGFQGVVKRHGFHGAPASHGTKDQLRMPGSIGATGPAHVFKGTRMGGQMGNEKATTAGLEIIEIDKENNLIKVKGAVPGARNSLVAVRCDGEMKILETKKQEKTADKKQEEEKDKKESNKMPEEKVETVDIKKESKEKDKEESKEEQENPKF